MNSLLLIGFVFEIWSVMFLVWGAFHEKQLIAWEKKTAERIRKAVRK